MTNRQIYARILPLSLMRLLWGLLGWMLWAALTLAGARGILPVGLALLAGLAIFLFFARHGGYAWRAGQIALTARAVAGEALPASALAAGRAAVKERFGTVGLCRAVADDIAAINGQLARAEAGGPQSKASGKVRGALRKGLFALAFAYLNRCCLGWVFWRREENVFQSACEGTAICDMRRRVLRREAGKSLAWGGASFLILGSALTIVLCAGAEDIGAIAADPLCLKGLAFCLALGLWQILHEAFIAPYFLLTAMRSFMDAGRGVAPEADIYARLCDRSPGFANMLRRARQA